MSQGSTSVSQKTGGSRIARYSGPSSRIPSGNVSRLPTSSKRPGPRKGSTTSLASQSPTSPTQKISCLPAKSASPTRINASPTRKTASPTTKTSSPTSKLASPTTKTSSPTRRSNIPASARRPPLPRTSPTSPKHVLVEREPVLQPAPTDKRPPTGLAARRGSTNGLTVLTDDCLPPRPPLPRETDGFVSIAPITKEPSRSDTKDPYSLHAPKRTPRMSPPRYFNDSPPTPRIPLHKEGYTLLAIPKREAAGSVPPRVLPYQSQQGPVVRENTLATGNTIRMGFGNRRDFEQAQMDSLPSPVHDYEEIEEFNFDGEKVEVNTEFTSSGYTSGGDWLDVQSSRRSDTDESSSDYATMPCGIVMPDAFTRVTLLEEIAESPPPLRVPRADQPANLEHVQVRMCLLVFSANVTLIGHKIRDQTLIHSMQGWF